MLPPVPSASVWLSFSPPLHAAARIVVSNKDRSKRRVRAICHHLW
jgi:hypothetical protein